MILHSGPQQITHQTSTYSTNQAKAAQEISTTQETQEASSSGKLKHGGDVLIPHVEADPEFARKMAKDAAYIPDKLLIDLSKSPSFKDASTYNQWKSNTLEFDKIAAEVTEQRIEMYGKMKAEGASDSDIYKQLMAFNHSLPMDYQVKSGMLKVNEYA
ncbi:hypothetical protein L1077_13750 [Pseudoalteromonas luteoviolacea]|uniref:hypothetical protein n=1 Tax=Pseudoalteromonas luteoviolacea TaxID=43657 RepID=UPI001F48C5C6|nr:hypothetical protein [Pseudoalteromonas luteoviolacea]MCF6440496.1 hypothetical protein [Pseudoalteromonas luteoviolacea]